MIHSLKLNDEDGLAWEWEFAGHTYRAEYQGMRDSWALIRLAVEDCGISILEEIECVSLAEALLHSLDLARRPSP